MNRGLEEANRGSLWACRCLVRMPRTSPIARPPTNTRIVLISLQNPTSFSPEINLNQTVRKRGQQGQVSPTARIVEALRPSV